MLKLQLTDGTQDVVGIEYEVVRELPDEVPAGTKVRAHNACSRRLQSAVGLRLAVRAATAPPTAWSVVRAD